jgi:hypothetical protein
VAKYYPVASTPSTPTTPTTPSTPAAQPPYTVSPTPLTAKYVAGYPATISAKASQTTTFVGVVHIKLSADSTVIASAQATPNADGSIAVAVATSASATPGHYAGDITVNVCKDANCTGQLDGAPFKVPYVVDVVSPDGGVTATSSTPPATAQQWAGNVLLTKNLVFVSTDGATYAIDRSTHAQVWTYPFGGKLSMSSNGILYINGLSSILAVNLK